MKKSLLVIVSLFLYHGLFAQDVIKGIIKDETGQELPGASVVIKGSSYYTLTDINGNFSLKTPKEYPFVLAVNFVGYETQEIEIYELAEEAVEISLKLQNVLSEFVVVGYGEQKRSDFTGSLSTVPSEVKLQPVSSPDRLLQGSVAGIQVTQSSGQPGSGTSIRIRGGTSINAGSEPLYVIDGFPIYNSNASADAGVISGDKINPLSAFNPEDIESIQVLKDASATAIYGSRGANGVIIITTKRSQRNENNISYSGYYGVQSVIRKLPVLNAQQWGALKNDAMIDAGKTPAFTDAQLQDLGKGTDWQDEAFRTAALQSHSLSLSKGSEKSNLIFSGNYFQQDGVLINTGFERYTAKLNLDYDITDRLRFGAFLNGSHTKAKVAPNGTVQSLLEMPPSIPVKDEEGKYTVMSEYETQVGNPINSLVNNTNETSTNRFLLNGFGEYTLLDGLKLKVMLGADVITNKQNRYLPSTVFEGQPGGIASVGSLSTLNWLNENTLSYSARFGNHGLDFLAGFTQQQSKTETHISRSANFVNDAFKYNDIGSGTLLLAPSSSYSAWALKSWLGRVNYNYNDRYLATFTLRSDGSSRFGHLNRWGVFPSAAVAWNVSNEGFLKQSSAIDLLKLRFSVGRTGNQEIPAYQSLARLDYYSANFGGKLTGGFAPSSYANPNLSWETTVQYNLGYDLALYRNRINLIMDIYNKRTTDLLLNVPIPYSSGLESAFQNFGSIENKGIEISLQTQNTTGAFKWNTSVVYAINRNKVLSLAPGITEFIPINPANSNRPSEIVRVGEPLGNFYMYKADGVFQAGDNFNLSPSQNVKEGSQKYKDLDGDGRVTSTGDIDIVGNSQPLWIGGITNSFSYKNFDLVVFFQGSYGNKIFSNTKALLEIGSGFTNASATMLNRWTPTNTNTDVHRAIEDPSPTLSDRFVEDGSYLRLKNISLGYTFTKAQIQRAHLSKARVYVSLQNFLTITNYTGFDPEVSRNGQDNLYSGFDYGSYPGTKSVQVGVSLSL
jgi:TonB-linked SusC/RagA family outer membrane protein